MTNEETYINEECLVNCDGCNASLCCWDMAWEDFAEGRTCNCGIFDKNIMQRDLSLAALLRVGTLDE